MGSQRQKQGKHCRAGDTGRASRNDKAERSFTWGRGGDTCVDETVLGGPPEKGVNGLLTSISINPWKNSFYEHESLRVVK